MIAIFPTKGFMPIKKFRKAQIKINFDGIFNWFEQYQAHASRIKGRNLALSNMVLSISVCLDAYPKFYRGQCEAQMIHKKIYNVQIELDPELQIVNCANCSCVVDAGNSANCKHVAAVLYVMEQYAETGNIILARNRYTFFKKKRNFPTISFIFYYH